METSLTEGYSVFMALQDYMPVFLSSLGLFILARMVARIDGASGKLAYLGWFMVTSGGFNKATWKLIMAASNNTVNHGWLDDSLFLLMGPGFICMGFAIWYAQRKMQENKPPFFGNVFIVPGIVNGVFVGLALMMAFMQPEKRIWFFILLGLTTIGNFVVGGLVIRQGWKMGSMLVVLLFGFNLIAILMMTGMARVDPQTIPLEWTAQITNTVSNGAFAFAAWKLSQMMETRQVSAASGAGLQQATA